MLSIQLNASFENWKLYWLRRNHPRFKTIALKVFERDQYTCQYCDFQIPKSDSIFDVVNKDYNYNNNRLQNFLTACPLCAQCFFLESIGTGDFGGGSLIRLPEITQVELNAFCNQAFIAMQMRTYESASAESTLRDFRFRTADVEKIFGDGMSDPAKFGTLMLTAQLPREKLTNILAPLRLLPARARFSEYIESIVRAKDALNALNEPSGALL